MGSLSLLIFASMAEVERVFLLDRMASARESRRSHGKPIGRKIAHSADAIAYARLLRAQDPQPSLTAISRSTGIPKTSLIRYLAEPVETLTAA